MEFDAFKYEYPSRRSVIYGGRGMVCTSQNLAAETGLDILRQIHLGDDVDQADSGSSES